MAEHFWLRPLGAAGSAHLHWLAPFRLCSSGWTRLSTLGQFASGHWWIGMALECVQLVGSELHHCDAGLLHLRWCVFHVFSSSWQFASCTTSIGISEFVLALTIQLNFLQVAEYSVQFTTHPAYASFILLLCNLDQFVFSCVFKRRFV